MYARMTTIHTQPGTLDEAIRIARDAVLPAARQQPGIMATEFQTLDRADER